MGLELPEILNLSRQMEKTLKNKIISEIVLGERSKGLIKQGMCSLDEKGDEILNSPIKSVKSRGKWIFIGFKNEMFLVLGELIGKFRYLEDEKDFPDSYHVLFQFTDGSALSFQSSLYAFLLAADKEEIHDHKYAGNIGPSPVDEEFTYSYFCDILSKYNNRGIKGVLNLQGELSGLGNAYINDILYKARIHPKAKVSSLKDSEKKELYDVIIETVNTAINKRGSIKEYDLFGETGNYVRLVDQPVKNMKCTICGVQMVKMNVMGSSSYVCPQCQRM
jgi:formamidopyrimidine-DNA glycosylase